MASPVIPPRRTPDVKRAGGIALGCIVAMFGVLTVVNSFSNSGNSHKIHNQDQLISLQGQKINALSTVAGKNQEQVSKLGGTPIGPNPSEIANAKTTPPPASVNAPQSPEAGGPVVSNQQLSAAEQGEIVNDVLSRIKVPAGKSPTSDALDSAIVATITAHPGLTSGQVSAATMSYLQANAKTFTGKPGVDGHNGLNGKDCNPESDSACIGPRGTGVRSAGIDSANFHLVLALDNGSSIETTDSLPKGETGATGVKGDTGQTGDPGADGTNGTNGTDGKNGVDGKDGLPGAQGIQGVPGPAPTAEDLDASVKRYIAANPLPLCPDGTQIQQVNVLTAEGGTVQMASCVVTSTNPSTEPPTDPASVSDSPTP